MAGAAEPRCGLPKFVVKVGQLLSRCRPPDSGTAALQAVFPHGDIQKGAVKIIKKQSTLPFTCGVIWVSLPSWSRRTMQELKPRVSCSTRRCRWFWRWCLPVAAVGADAGAHARSRSHSWVSTGVQVGGEVGRVFVGAVPLAGGGCDYQLITHKVGGIHPIAVL